MHDKKYIKLEADYTNDRSWFIVYLVAFVFGIIWTILGEDDLKIIFITATFTCFIRAGIQMEMSARALDGDDSH